MPAAPNPSFPASYDRTTKIISCVCAAVLLVPVFITQNILVAGLAAVVFCGAYAFSPRRYTIADRSIIINRLLGTVRIPLDGVREIRPATADDVAGGIRLWGNGGLFGYYGLFRTSKLGNCRWYVTNRKNMVVVITANATVLVSPDDVDGFLAVVRAVSPVPSTSPGTTAELRASSGIGSLVVKVAGVMIAVLAVGFVVFAVTYSPGPPSYALTPNALAIHDRFYPVKVDKDDVDVGQIRVVDIRTDSKWRPMERTDGFANSHYHSGWFRGRQRPKCSDILGRGHTFGAVAGQEDWGCDSPGDQGSGEVCGSGAPEVGRGLLGPTLLALLWWSGVWSRRDGRDS
jgi:hypothetical protein